MPVLTDLASAEVNRLARTLYGVTLTRPALVVSEGFNVGYACDVDITETDSSGQIQQYMDKKGHATVLSGLPGQRPEDWQLDDSLPGHVDTTMHNVPIARNNTELQYAEIGSPVILSRSNGGLGQWEITGFSIEQPGTHKLYPVNLGDMTIGTVIDLSIETRLLTLAEFGEIGPFGSFALGASGIFQGGELLRVV